MKNKEFYKLLKKNKLNLNSGFTLTELLVGLVMSIFVIGALGFGLMTVLQTTQSENSKVQARTENSRALDFISDEVRRAKNIETSAANAGSGFSATGKTIVLALDIPEISSNANAGVRGRIVYYLKSTGLGNWKGPQVLYRWGPPLNADGSYPSDVNGRYDSTVAWSDQALIDGINSTPVTPVTSACPTGTTTTPAAPTGFYACITGTNTAQLFLTGQTKTASGIYNDSQTNDTQVVARARETLSNKTDKNDSIQWSVKGLGGKYSCTSTTSWDMKTEFYNDPAKKTEWMQNADTGSKQPQPIEIKATAPLTIMSTPQGGTGCDSRPDPISHTIDFKDPLTFNGNPDPTKTGYSNSLDNKPQVTNTNSPAVQFFKKGYDIPTSYGGYDANNDGVITIPRDADGDGIITVAEGLGSTDQPSLGRFLFEQGLAIPKTAGANPYSSTTEFTIPTTPESLQSFLASSYGSALLTAEKEKFRLMGDDQRAEKEKFRLMGDDQRIIAFEVGQIYPDKKNDGSAIPGGKNPGFDLQDNIFVVTSDVFKTKFESSCFSGGNCNPSTGEPNPPNP